MTTEVETVMVEVDKDNEDMLQWEIVSDDLRTATRNKFSTNPIILALEEGKTVKVHPDYKLDPLYRWSRANDYILHRRAFDGFTILWITDKEE